MNYPEYNAEKIGSLQIKERMKYYKDNKDNINDMYLKLRAFNQAYMERIKPKEKIKLYRVIDGPEGKEIANLLIEGKEKTLW